MRLYGYLFNDEDPESEEAADFMEKLNKDSLQRLYCCKRAGLQCRTGQQVPVHKAQVFLRGYGMFKAGVVFNRIVSLKDTWAKLMKGHEAKQSNNRAEVNIIILCQHISLHCASNGRIVYSFCRTRNRKVLSFPRGMKAAGNTKYTIKIKLSQSGQFYFKTNNK